MLQLFQSHNIVSLVVVVVALRSCSRVFTLFSYLIFLFFSFFVSSASPIGLQWFYSLLFFHRVSHCVAVGCLLFCSPEFPLWFLVVLTLCSWLGCSSLLFPSPCYILVLIHGSVVLAFHFPCLLLLFILSGCYVSSFCP